MAREKKKKAGARPANVIFQTEYQSVETQIHYTMINSDFIPIKKLINQWISAPLQDEEIPGIFNKRNPLIAFQNELSARGVKLLDNKGDKQDWVAGDSDSFIGAHTVIPFSGFETFAKKFAEHIGAKISYHVDELAKFMSHWISPEHSKPVYIAAIRTPDALLDYLSHFDLNFVDGDQIFSISTDRQKFVDVLSAAMSALPAESVIGNSNTATISITPQSVDSVNSKVDEKSTPAKYESDAVKQQESKFFYPDADILCANITDAELASVKRFGQKGRELLTARINKLDLCRIFPPDRKGTGFICPICGNGTGDTGDGIRQKIYPDDTIHYHCFSHGDFNGVLTQIIGKLNGLGRKQYSDWYKILAIGQKILDYAETHTRPDYVYTPIQKSGREYSPEEIDLLQSDIADAQKHIEDLPLVERRGLTLETLRHFHFGFLIKWIYHKNRLEGRNFPYSPRIIIPTGDGKFPSYNAVLPRYARKANKNKSLNGGFKQLFNPDALIADSTVIVTEGEIDAASVYQSGYQYACATGGASSYKTLLKVLDDKFSDNRTKFNFVILFDNDDEGKKCGAELQAELMKRGYPAVCAFLSFDEQKIDANDILCNDGENALFNRLNEIIADAQIKFAQISENANAANVIGKADNAAQNDSVNDLNEKNISENRGVNANPNKIDSLSNELRDIEKQIAEFEKEKIAAIESLKDVETFGSETVFDEKILTAAAFARLYDKKAYSDFYRAIKNYGDKHKDEKAMMNSWIGAVKEKAEEISYRDNDLTAEHNTILAAIKNKSFVDKNPIMENFTLPTGYVYSMDSGIAKFIDDKRGTVKVSEVPLIICGKTKSVYDADKKFKLILQYWSRDGKSHILPATPKSTLLNAQKLIDLADDGLPVSSGDARLMTAYLNSFQVENDAVIPQICTVPKCGWYDFGDGDIFVDPRLETKINDEGNVYPLKVDSQSHFAKSLTSRGNLDNWKKAYEMACKSPVARLIVAASIAPPLLKVTNERNFLLYLYTRTLAGKTTALNLGASAVGNEKLIRSFDATKNGLVGAAADVNDYPFLLDEKQSADKRLSEQCSLLSYALANGIGRTKLKKDSSLRDTDYWRTIVVMTGETPLLDDSATGGAHTRTLQLLAPRVILDSDTCRDIRAIIKDNYGLVFPMIIQKISEYGAATLKEKFNKISAVFAKKHDEILPVYQRYIAVLTLADYLLNVALGKDEKHAANDALRLSDSIFELVPTLDEIDDTQRAVNAVYGFIAENQSRFIGGNVEIDKMQKFYGEIMFGGNLIYITVDAMKAACTSHNLNYDKTINDLIAANVISVADKVEKGYKEPRKLVKKRLGGVSARCYKLINPSDDSHDPE